MGNEENLSLLGAVLSIIIIMSISTFLNFSFANAKNIRFEISACSVQGNSTYEKSGPCPDPNSKTELSNGPEVTIAEPSPKVSVVSEKGKTEPAPKISSLEAADQVEPKVSSALNNGIDGAGVEDETNIIRYNFNDLHISGPEKEVDNSPQQKAIPSPAQNVLVPINPFGSVTK